MAQQVKDPKLCPRDADSITGLALWVKDLALLQDEAQFTKAAWIWCCCGCGVGHGSGMAVAVAGSCSSDDS